MSQGSEEDRPPQSAVDANLLSLLVCPACHERLEERSGLLVCLGCGLGYLVRDGIPVMLIDEAIPRERQQASPASSASLKPGEGERER